MNWPPLMVSVEPVIQAASSAARNTHAARDLVGLAQAADRDLADDRLHHVFGDAGEQVGRDIARRDRVHGDALARAFERQRPGEADHAGFGRAVIGEAELALLAVDRGDVDDAAEAPLAHAVDHRPGHVEQRVEIGADHLLPLLVRHLLEHGVARDAGIVDQHLDRADLVLDIDDALLAGDIVAHVPFKDRDLGFLLEGLGGVVVAAVIGGDLVAGLLQSLANGGADAARSTRDQSHPSHAFLPLKRSSRRFILHSTRMSSRRTREDAKCD